MSYGTTIYWDRDLFSSPSPPSGALPAGPKALSAGSEALPAGSEVLPAGSEAQQLALLTTLSVLTVIIP